MAPVKDIVSKYEDLLKTKVFSKVTGNGPILDKIGVGSHFFYVSVYGIFEPSRFNKVQFHI